MSTMVAPALEGIRVIDATAFAAGPSATRFLADWGAEVVHVEHPVRGDTTRVSFQGNMKGFAANTTVNYLWEHWNRNKKSLTLDFSHERSQEIVSRLIEKADVFVTNFRPRELDKFGLTYERLSAGRPELVYASLTGYGRKGPDRDMPGFDWTGFWARSAW